MEVASEGVPSFCLSLCIRPNLFLPPKCKLNQANEVHIHRTNQDGSNTLLDHIYSMVLVLQNAYISQGNMLVNLENLFQAASSTAPNTCETFNK